jgi:hemolysin III
MPLEEKLNAWSHGMGVILGIAALVLLLLGVDTNNPWGLFSVIVYGLSIILLFLASTCYHAITPLARVCNACLS